MSNSRTLPVKVDGRLKIGPFTLINFIKWVWIPVSLLIFLLTNPSQSLFIFTLLVSAITSFPFMEFKHRQTGIDFFKELVVYDLRSIVADFFPNLISHKTIIFERREYNDSIIQKFTFNEKVYEIQKRKRQKLK